MGLDYDRAEHCGPTLCGEGACSGEAFHACTVMRIERGKDAYCAM